MASIAKLNPVNNPAKVQSAQLPIAWYTDPAIYRLEQAHIFAHAPRYIGHELMVPEQGDFHTLDWMNHAKALVHNEHGVQLISNVCRHRQAVMLDGRGNTPNIVCPLHRWTYNLDGELLGAPHFPQKPCLQLETTKLQAWNGLLFDSTRNVAKDIGGIPALKKFDFTGYMLNRVMIEEYDFNWKTFIEVYLEDYHVGPFHPGLAQFVDCDDLHWSFGQEYSIQTVGVKHALQTSGSPVYQRWQEQVMAYSANKVPEHGAIWMLYYPFLMVEWYPNVLVVSHIIPRGVNACSNVVEFYYPEDIALFESEFMAAHQAAYEETAIEDKEICRRMQNGRNALFALGADERGPYQHPMETGLEQFHLWIRKHLDQHIPEPR